MARSSSSSFLSFQSTPPARGATASIAASAAFLAISIHAPREGGDVAAQRLQQRRGISIHAPREGGDIPPGITVGVEKDFNPRPPRGGRQLPV